MADGEDGDDFALVRRLSASEGDIDVVVRVEEVRVVHKIKRTGECIAFTFEPEDAFDYAQAILRAYDLAAGVE
jgi:hypothetical protein